MIFRYELFSASTSFLKLDTSTQKDMILKKIEIDLIRKLKKLKKLLQKDSKLNDEIDKIQKDLLDLEDHREKLLLKSKCQS